MTPEQVQDYLKRSGDKQIYNINLIENEHGFLTWTVFEDMVYCLQAYGDGRHWDNVLINLAKELGLPKVAFSTKRKPKSYERKYGYKVTGYILEKEVI